VRYEGYGPGGVAVLVEAFTDNRNRTAADLRLGFSKHGGNLGESGCVGYLFEQRSVVRVVQQGTAALAEEPLLEALLALEEAGGPAVLAYDLEGERVEVIGAYADLEALQDGLRRQGLAVESWEHRWIPQTLCALTDPDLLRRCLRMLDALEDLDDVRSVTANLEADEALLEQVIDAG
jgi:YebC/PmpR family DNA-binding regulatory protein